MKFFFLTVSFACLVSAAVAGPPQKAPAKKGTVPAEISCAVVPGDKVNLKKATAEKRFADYKGRRYYFCCENCPQKFKKNPAKYAKSPSVPLAQVTKKG